MSKRKARKLPCNIQNLTFLTYCNNNEEELSELRLEVEELSTAMDEMSEEMEHLTEELQSKSNLIKNFKPLNVIQNRDSCLIFLYIIFN